VSKKPAYNINYILGFQSQIYIYMYLILVIQTNVCLFFAFINFQTAYVMRLRHAEIELHLFSKPLPLRRCTLLNGNMRKLGISPISDKFWFVVGDQTVVTSRLHNLYVRIRRQENSNKTMYYWFVFGLFKKL